MTAAQASQFRCSAVISDVDGTLVTNDKKLTERTVAAAAELRSSGIIFSVISSRPPRGLQMLIKALGITTPVAGFNGGVLVSADLAIISAHLLPAATARRTVDFLDERGVDVWLFAGQDWLLRDRERPYVALEERTVAFAPTIINDMGTALDAAAKIVGVSADFELLARCEGELRTALSQQATVVRSQPYYLDVTHPLANKGDALSDLAKRWHVPLAEVAAIGDGHNDVGMFERAGLSIAMGNASPEVQRAADFVTTSNSEDGFAHAIGRFILGAGSVPAPVDVAKAGDRPW